MKVSRGLGVGFSDMGVSENRGGPYNKDPTI